MEIKFDSFNLEANRSQQVVAQFEPAMSSKRGQHVMSLTIDGNKHYINVNDLTIAANSIIEHYNKFRMDVYEDPGA
jgi:hypothetical protein